jgi:DNA adenine methylase
MSQTKSRFKLKKSPLNYFGGKNNKINILLKFIPPHKIYVEPFGGSGALLFAKEPSETEVYNDIDSNLVNFFRVLRDPEKWEKLYQLLLLTPYSREEFNFCRKNYDDENIDEIEKARRYFVKIRQSFGGTGDGWGYSLTVNHASIGFSIIDLFPEFHQRIRNVQIENLDFRKIFEKYDTPDTFFYCDPPYIPETRRAREYQFELSEDDHRQLVDILLKLKGMVLLSGYKHPIYNPLEENGWERKDFVWVCEVVGRIRQANLKGEGALKRANQYRIESLWLSPNLQKALKTNLSLFENEDEILGNQNPL